MKCVIDGKEVNIDYVVEDMGYQGGYYVKAVWHDGKEHIVIKKNGLWCTKDPAEKIMPVSRMMGQGGGKNEKEQRNHSKENATGKERNSQETYKIRV